MRFFGAQHQADTAMDSRQPSVAERAGASADTPPVTNGDTELASEALSRIRRQLPEIMADAATRVANGSLGFIGWGLTRPRIQKLSAEDAAHPWYFVGDIHGDFLAWHALFERVRNEPDFRLCFLGDLVDRGPFSIECFAALLEAANRYPHQILWILGNHDEALRFNPAAKQPFSSTVEPAEFLDWLADDAGELARSVARMYGQVFVEVCQRLPRAVLFPDGLLATHGGIPLGDRWEYLTSMEAFHDDRVMGDFTWTRAATAPRKLGWKYDPEHRAYSSSFEYGYKDLEDFCSAVAPLFPVRRLVRGHDHVEYGFEIPKAYSAIPVLTINGFGFNYLTNSVHAYRQDLVLGVMQSGALPQVIHVPYSLAEHAALYPVSVGAAEVVKCDTDVSDTHSREIDEANRLGEREQ